MIYQSPLHVEDDNVPMHKRITNRRLHSHIRQTSPVESGQSAPPPCASTCMVCISDLKKNDCDVSVNRRHPGRLMHSHLHQQAPRASQCFSSPTTSSDQGTQGPRGSTCMICTSDLQKEDHQVPLHTRPRSRLMQPYLKQILVEHPDQPHDSPAAKAVQATHALHGPRGCTCMICNFDMEKECVGSIKSNVHSEPAYLVERPR